MTLRSQPSEGCASASFATSAHQIFRNIAGRVSTRNGKPHGPRPERINFSYCPAVPAAGAGAAVLFPNICAAIFMLAPAMLVICC